MTTEKMIAVGLGEIKVSKEADSILVSYGLGSCVGVTAYDPVVKVGAMAHIMLPEPLENTKDLNSAKFATVAIPLLIETIKSNGALISRVIWKIAGGAQVISVPGMNGRLQIGDRNIEMVKKTMKELNLKIAAEETGGKQGRTMQLFISTGKVVLRPAGGAEREL